jgi:hypothetical protein
VWYYCSELRHGWDDNFTVEFKAIRWEGMDWINVDQGRGKWWAVVKTVRNIQLPYSRKDFLTSWWTVSFSMRNLLHGDSECVSEWDSQVSESVNQSVSQSIKGLWEECCVFVRSKQKQNNIIQWTVLKNVT